MLHTGENDFYGLPVTVERKRRIRRINIRIGSDAKVYISLPYWYVTLSEAEAFLRSKWKWVTAQRNAILSRPAPAPAVPLSESELAEFKNKVAGFHDKWAAALCEYAVSRKFRRMKTIWGSCHTGKRMITYNTELARVPDELIEYVVVHELTHLKAANHGSRFYALMDMRLPGWKILRRKLNGFSISGRG